jgi:hypothetical protein
MRAPPVVLAFALLAACSGPDPATRTIVPKYDKTTGKLVELTFDRYGNGKVDTWTEMDGTRPLRSRLDLDEDGVIDRWEYYGDGGVLVKVGFSRNGAGKPDAWAFRGAGGRIERIEVSSAGDEKKIDRWEHFDASRPGSGPAGTGDLAAVEEDTRGDGRAHKWETYDHGALATASFDEDGDGRPDRRLVYRDGLLVTIETEPDASGVFMKRVDVK